MNSTPTPPSQRRSTKFILEALAVVDALVPVPNLWLPGERPLRTQISQTEFCTRK